MFMKIIAIIAGLFLVLLSAFALLMLLVVCTQSVEASRGATTTEAAVPIEMRIELGSRWYLQMGDQMPFPRLMLLPNIMEEGDPKIWVCDDPLCPEGCNDLWPPLPR